MEQLNLDILGIAETHLVDGKGIKLNGYTWVGNNRKLIHKRAKTGSGGVGFLIKDNILQNFNVEILDDSIEGILWLKLHHKVENIVLLPCVCYLPPENSTRSTDAHQFYDTLLKSIYEYQSDGLIFLCGDLNSRCGDSDDFIAGVDEIPHRTVVDFISNKYGELLIDFLINCNFCILNGRNELRNDFTSISTKGCSVVDYCLVSHDALSNFSSFSVTRATDLINQCNDVSGVATSGIPDHSVLTWKISVGLNNGCVETGRNEQNTTKDRFDLKSINEFFMSDASILEQVNATIADLEGGFRTQSNIDSAYDSWCTIVKSEMYERLPYKSIKVGCNNKRRRVAKPWWNDRLSELWNDMCDHESRWLKCSVQLQKSNFKSVFITSRRKFDREVQRAKRLYWYSLQNNMLNEVNKDQTEFWRNIGKVGISQTKKNKTPFEVVLDDGTISSDKQVVFERWERDFSDLLNSNAESDMNQENNHNSRTRETTYPMLNDHISIFEVKKVIDDAKRGKSVGIDELPSEVLKNDISVSFLHVLFNICFVTGIVPSVWNKSIINPIPKSSQSDPRDPLSYRGITLASSMYKLYSALLNNQ